MSLLWLLSNKRGASIPPRMGAAFAAGALTVLTMPPFSVLFFVPFVFSTLFAVLRGLSVRQACLIGWTFGLGQFGFGLFWIAESFYVDAERFGALAIPAVAGLSAGLAIFPALAAALYTAMAQRGTCGIISSLLLATCWTAAEWMRGHFLTGFPWSLVGYAFVDYAYLRQPAAWIGSYGLSFLTVFIGALPASAWYAARGQRWQILVTAPAAAAAMWGAGAIRLEIDAPTSTGIMLRIVQGNVPQKEKWLPDNRDVSFNRYLALSRSPGQADLLLWPETAFPGYLDEDVLARDRIANALPEGRLLLSGVPDRVVGVDATEYFNTVQVYEDTGEVLARYAKHHLVPFGEYVPLRGWLPIARLTEGLGDFTPGPGPRTLSLPGAPSVAVAICYEIIFPSHVVDDRLRPAWIFNATNDAWFGTSFGPEQHLASARMRALEEGLPIARAANTGISAVIDAKGEIVRRLDTGETGILDAALPGALPPTLYSRLGDWMLLIFIGISWCAAWLGARFLNAEVR